MGDRLPVRDRTLILRILVPGLEQRLRDKMKETEDDFGSKNPSAATPTSTNNNATQKETLLDLDGVTCEPTGDASTLWHFHCDGATYPARLVNLPCPVEVHKTHDHAMYYKSCDVAQMLIVYEDSMALDEADAVPKTEGYPSYYHSGITPPMKQVVEKRFAMREHQPRAPPRNEVADVERDIHQLMTKISKEGSAANKRNKVPSLMTAQHQNKVLEEVLEEVVDYEPWMDDAGRQPAGIEFDVSDDIAQQHPEIWLAPEKLREIREQEQEREEEERKKIEAAAAKKEKKKKKKEKKAAAAAAAAAESSTPSKKKGIASKKNKEPVDDITQAALALNSGDLLDAVLDEDDDFLDLGFDMEGLDMEDLGM